MNRIVARLALISAGLILGGQMASAETTTARTFAYKAYYGGIAVVDVTADIAVSNTLYDVTTTSRSVGFLEYVFPFTSRANGRGALNVTSARREFVQDSLYRGKSRMISLGSHGAGAPVVKVTPPIPHEDRAPVPLSFQTGTLDPIAALVSSAVRPTAEAACSGTLEVFNGKTRTNVTLTHTGRETLAKTGYSIYSGPAEKCEARYETLAGAYKKSWFGKDNAPPVIHFWIAQLGPAQSWTPVRAQAETELAQIVVHLTDVKDVDAIKIGQR